MNPAAANGHEGPHCNEYPEKYSLQKRSNSDFAESLHGEPHSNQAERNGQTDSAKMIEYMIALACIIHERIANGVFGLYEIGENAGGVVILPWRT